MQLNHVLVRTTDLTAMTSFWQQVIGLEPGFRPSFDFSGAWLYSGGQPLIHLSESPSVPAGAGALAHVALDGGDFDAFMQRLEGTGSPYELAVVPDSGERQVFVQGPDDLVVEMQFPPVKTLAAQQHGDQT